jgi:hypothetical protein
MARLYHTSRIVPQRCWHISLSFSCLYSSQDADPLSTPVLATLARDSTFWNEFFLALLSFALSLLRPLLKIGFAGVIIKCEFTLGRNIF